MARDDETRDEGLGLLRRWTVLVLLTLLVFVTVGEFIDAVAFGDRFQTDPAFYTLVGGMVTGLFAAEVLAIMRRSSGRNGNGGNGNGKAQ